MSKRHLFESPDGLVNKALRGIIAYNPSLSLDEGNRIVYDTAYNRANVSLISGGGSGHEPAYVGENMLAASVPGDIFASPSTKQIVAAVEAVPSDKGTILVVYDLGVAFSQQIVSIAATLDHCHVPGRTEHATLKEDEVELGTGPHNEPGFLKLSPPPSPSELVAKILKNCLDESDPERGYVHFAPGDETFLLVSNFGGMSHLEMGALVDELLEQLETTWSIEPVRVVCGFLETSLNAPAFSVSVVNASAAARNCSYSLDQIKSFFDGGPVALWGAALSSALSSLRRYTPAKVGDRTVMDTLIPFAEAMEKAGFAEGVDAAIKGAEATKTMTPRLGRATYVGGSSDNSELPPDPGAWGAMVAIRGLKDGHN
uniref:DhaK domain-containing protein n=1 Tax=Bionectria ochroleuca TaxID=29856 RepID=A0A0B7KNF8_BIOOC